MRDDFLDIVAVIVRQMAENDEAGLKGRSILDGLLDEGYDLLEIDDALSWFESLAGVGSELGGVELHPGFKGVRVQASWERKTIDPEAFGYLMKLNAAGVVDDSLREAVIDKIAELSMPKFGLEQMRALLGLVLYSRENHATEESFALEDGSGQDSLTN